MATSSPPGFPVTARFHYVATLGRGGMGCVYEAIDRERGLPVALKTLLEVSPQRILHLKREFRALRDVRHPNLVSLDDLVEADGTWFFTMELLRGPDLTGHVRAGGRRPPPPPSGPTGSTTSITWEHDEALAGPAIDPFVPPPTPADRPAAGFDELRLRDALHQLARGLGALHAAGLVHRDVKPSNVLVAGDRVVLLDFGIAGRLEGEPHDGSMAGTWPYAAPEQLRGGPPSPAADAYALGMCLFEALTGRLPLRGRPRPWVVASRPAPDPRDHVRDLPDDLAALCVRLLDPAPERRPSVDDVLAVLDGPAAPRRDDRGAPLVADPDFVGRDDELEALDRAFEATRYGDAVCALVDGESGVGKTRLVQEFLARARRAHATALVLEARCHARELVPYGAVDGIVDGIARTLSVPGAPELGAFGERLPAEVAALLRAFPVLAGVPALARVPATAPGDDASSRHAAFAGLRELLAHLADERVVILSIDDVQWADPDSLKLLAEVFAEGRAPPLLLVATLQLRDGDPPHPIVRALGCRIEHVAVRPLAEDAAAALARGIAAGLSAEPALDAALIAREAGGHPLFVAELVRHALGRADPGSRPVELERALVARIAALPAEARRLLEIVAIATAPIPHEVAAAAAALDDAAYAEPMTRLARAHLIRLAGVRRSDRVEPYHRRVQAAVGSTLEPDARRALHGALAGALEERGGASDEMLAVHHEHAGARDRAAHHAVRAARRAASALAFERAAGWYRKALELGGGDHEERRRVAVALGDVLVDAGQPLDAAETYRGAAAIGTPSPAERFELRRRSADQYLVGGYLPQGVAAMQALLAELGLAPGSRAAAALRVGFDRARLIGRGVRFVPRDAATIAPERLAEIDVCWSGASGLGQVDGMQGAIFALHGTLLSLACGEPLRVSRALSAFSISEASLGHRERARRALEASWHAARIAGTPLARFYPQLTELVCAYQVDHDWTRCLDGCRAAGQTWREAGRGRGWESNYVDVYTFLSLYRLGRVASAREHVDGLLAATRAARNRFLEIALRLLSPFRYLVLDRPDEALADLEDAFASWSASLGRISHQHYWRLAARMSISLYRGLGAAERDALDAEWRRMYQAPLGRIGMYRLEMARTRALFAIGRAVDGRARRAVAALEREPSPLGREYALELAASLAMAEGRPERAVAALRTLVPRLDGHRHVLAGMVARWCLGRLVGGTEGEALTRTAATWAAAEGVRDLDRLARTVLPGVAP